MKNTYGEKLLQETIKLMDNSLTRKEALLYSEKIHNSPFILMEEIFSIILQSVQAGNIKRGLKYYGVLLKLSKDIDELQEKALVYYNQTLFQ